MLNRYLKLDAVDPEGPSICSTGRVTKMKRNVVHHSYLQAGSQLLPCTLLALFAQKHKIHTHLSPSPIEKGRTKICLPAERQSTKGKPQVSVCYSDMHVTFTRIEPFRPASKMNVHWRVSNARKWWPFGFWDECTCTVCDVSICVCIVTRKKNLNNISVCVYMHKGGRYPTR